MTTQSKYKQNLDELLTDIKTKIDNISCGSLRCHMCPFDHGKTCGARDLDELLTQFYIKEQD